MVAVVVVVLVKKREKYCDGELNWSLSCSNKVMMVKRLCEVCEVNLNCRYKSGCSRRNVVPVELEFELAELTLAGAVVAAAVDSGCSSSWQMISCCH